MTLVSLASPPALLPQVSSWRSRHLPRESLLYLSLCLWNIFPRWKCPILQTNQCSSQHSNYFLYPGRFVYFGSGFFLSLVLAYNRMLQTFYTSSLVECGNPTPVLRHRTTGPFASWARAWRLKHTKTHRLRHRSSLRLECPLYCVQGPLI